MRVILAGRACPRSARGGGLYEDATASLRISPRSQAAEQCRDGGVGASGGVSISGFDPSGILEHFGKDKG